MYRATWPLSFLRRGSVGGGGGSPWIGPPGLVSSGTVTDRGGTGNPLQVPYPAGLNADDIILMQILSMSIGGTTHDITTPGSFAEWSEMQLAFPSWKHALYWLRASGSESGTETVTTSIGTLGAGDIQMGKMTAWRGCVATGTPLEQLGTNGATSVNMTGSAVTTAGDDRTIINVCACDDNTLSAEASGWTEQYEELTAINSDAAIKLYSKEKPTAGLEAAATHVLATSERWAVITGALIPV